MSNNTDMAVYFSGEKLYGDDFTLEDIQQWYDDEAEGYASLGDKSRENYKYLYHSLNAVHGFHHLPKSQHFERVLGFGSAYGDEIQPLADRIGELTIIDPSDTFVSTSAFGVPISYSKPSVRGELGFSDNHFDLALSLGVLHHIPNISFVLGELHRCLKPGGFALIREPVFSMGDWRKPRPGLTKRERGIPLTIFRQMLSDLQFEVVREKLCMFPPIPRMLSKIRVDAYNSPVLTRLDGLVSSAFAWNLRYHAESFFQKLRPTSCYYVLKKRE